MSKLFEIPIYAMDRKALNKKYFALESKIKEENKECDAEKIQRCIDIETYPKRIWDYNHVVGYIQILAKCKDIVFEVYLPYQKKRYFWKSEAKIFLYNIQVNGAHFYVDKKKTNSDIQDQVVEMLNNVIKHHIPKRYFVDIEAFETLNGMVDYQSVIGRD